MTYIRNRQQAENMQLCGAVVYIVRFCSANRSRLKLLTGATDEAVAEDEKSQNCEVSFDAGSRTAHRSTGPSILCRRATVSVWPFMCWKTKLIAWFARTSIRCNRTCRLPNHRLSLSLKEATSLSEVNRLTRKVHKITYTSLSRSLKVTGTGSDRSATSDFLLVTHSNHGPISYCFRDKRRFRSKIANFPHPLREFPWNLITAVELKIWSRLYQTVKKVWRYMHSFRYYTRDRCKNVFFVFYSGHVFKRFLTFFLFRQRFLFLKNVHWKYHLK